MDNPYIKYLKDRLRKKFPFVSGLEMAAINVVDNYEAKGDFALLMLYPQEGYLLSCTTDSGNNRAKRIYISEILPLSHNFNNIFSEAVEDVIRKYELAYFPTQNGTLRYDSDYDITYPELADHNAKISESISSIPDLGDIPIYINGKYSDMRALRFALQKKSNKVVVAERHENLNISKRALISRGVIAESLNTSISHTNVLSCLQPLEVCVPLDTVSLEASFWGNFKWSDVLPDDSPDCVIGGKNCKFLTIKMEVDCFNNVFCHISDLAGRIKYMLIHDALNAGISANEETTSADEKDQKSYDNDVVVDNSQAAYDNNPPSSNINTPSKEHKEAKPKAVKGPSVLKSSAGKFTHFIFDSNALLDCPDLIPSIASIEGKTVIVPLMVSEEIDKIKNGKKNREKHEEAKLNYKYINSQYADKIKIESVTDDDIKMLPLEIQAKERLSPDDLILAIAIRHRLKNEKICFVTSDRSFRTKCESLPKEKKPFLLYPNQVLNKNLDNTQS